MRNSGRGFGRSNPALYANGPASIFRTACSVHNVHRGAGRRWSIMKGTRGARPMAIQQLEIRGYRSFREAVWRPGRLNLLVGPNGGGKSNLLRILELISNASKGKLAESIN